MLSLDYLRMIWDYNYWGHHKLLDCLATISENDFNQAIPYSIGSLHEQVVHIMWAEALWLARINDQPRIEWTKDDFPGLEAVRQNWTLVENDWRKFLASLTAADTEYVLEVKRFSGEICLDPVWQIMLHVVNHGTDHRGQMLRIIHDFGGKTFEQDAIYYFREKNAEVKNA